MTDLLGGKGANLAEMSLLGINVPPGFTVTTEVCNYFMKHGHVPENFDEELKQSLKNTGRHVSMDAPLIEGEDSNLYDVMGSDESPSPDTQLMLDSLREEIRRALDTLTPREADVVSSYFGLNAGHAMTLEEIGEKFDLTRERVRQIKEKAVRRLKQTSRSKILKTYLG